MENKACCCSEKSSTRQGHKSIYIYFMSGMMMMMIAEIDGTIKRSLHQVCLPIMGATIFGVSGFEQNSLKSTSKRKQTNAHLWKVSSTIGILPLFFFFHFQYRFHSYHGSCVDHKSLCCLTLQNGKYAWFYMAMRQFFFSNIHAALMFSIFISNFTDMIRAAISFQQNGVTSKVVCNMMQ